MSKRVVASSERTCSFQSHLKDIGEIAAQVPGRARGSRLGRTAALLETAKEAATKEGFEAGHAEGYAEGFERGMLAVVDAHRSRIDAFGKDLDEAANRVDNAMADWYRRSEVQLADLAIVVAAQIIGREVQADKNSVLPFVKEALSEVALSDKVRIRVNPFDSPCIKEHEQAMIAFAPSVQRVEVVNDPSIAGGCIVESDGGAVDATIRTKIDLILQSFREAA